MFKRLFNVMSAALVLSSSSLLWADSIPTAKFAAKTRIGKDQSDLPTPPIRMTKAHIIVMKSWQEKQADGSFVEQGVQVCDVANAAIPVYSGGTVNIDPNLMTKCNSTVKSQPVEISVPTFMVDTRSDDPFNPGHQKDYKMFATFIIANGPPTTPTPQGPLSSNLSTAITEDPNLHTLIESATIDHLTTDLPGDTQTDEVFTTFVRFED